MLSGRTQVLFLFCPTSVCPTTVASTVSRCATTTFYRLFFFTPKTTITILICGIKPCYCSLGKLIKKLNQTSFTLYLAHNRVDRGNLVLKFDGKWGTECKTLRSLLLLRISEALCVVGRNSTPRFASTPERKNVNINLNKYFISLSGDQTHNQSR